jgi:hypothetical protein
VDVTNDQSTYRKELAVERRGHHIRSEHDIVETAPRKCKDPGTGLRKTNPHLFSTLLQNETLALKHPAIHVSFAEDRILDCGPDVGEDYRRNEHCTPGRG